MLTARAVLPVLLMLACAGCASRPLVAKARSCDGPKTEVRISGPHGERLLKGMAANNWYPARALALGKQGSASVRCAVTQHHGRDCAVVSEEPPRLGFGALAGRAAAKLDAPKGSDGADVELRYRWTILTGSCRRYIVSAQPSAALPALPYPSAAPSRGASRRDSRRDGGGDPRQIPGRVR